MGSKPIINQLSPLPFPSLRAKESNKISQAVIEVKGKPAASANPSDSGFFPTIRSSTAWNSEFVPARVKSPVKRFME